ncbi:hypothetical protein Tco_0052173 [Tanacetum coccineum]
MIQAADPGMIHMLRMQDSDFIIMTSKYFRLELGFKEKTGLVQNLVSSTPYVPPSKKDYDILFQPLFDEYFQSPSSVVSPMLPVVAQLSTDTTGTPSSTIIVQDVPSISISSTTREIQSLVIHQEVPDEPKDNSGRSSCSLSEFNDEVQDVSSDEENKADENKATADVAERKARDEQPV